MLSVPLGNRMSGWIEPAAAAVNVLFHVRSCLAVQPSGHAGLRLAMQNPSPGPNGVIGAPSPGRNIPLDRVAPSSSLCASAATASPIMLASGRLKAGLVDPEETGAVVSCVHAATAASAATA